MTNEEFETIVKQTLSELPKEFIKQIENIEIVIEDVALNKKGRPDMRLLGLYHGVPRTERTGEPLYPDKITLYKVPLLKTSESIDEVKKQIKKTVLHELGHYFGLSDADLERLAY